MELLIQLIWGGISTGSIYGLIAIGYNIVYNSSRMVNFSQGEFFTFGAMLVLTFTGGLASTAVFAHLPLPILPLVIAIVISVTATVLLALAAERLIFRRALKFSPFAASNASFGVIFLLQGIYQLIFSRDYYFTSSFMKFQLQFMGATLASQAILVLLTVIGAVLILWAYFFRTSQGLAMRAGAENPDAARILGISTTNLVRLSFIIASVIGAIAGIVIAPMVILGYDSGLAMTLKAFAAAILGGLGNVFGAMVGGIVLGLMEAFAGGYISTVYKDAIVFSLLILILLYRPTGIFGKSV